MKCVVWNLGWSAVLVVGAKAEMLWVVARAVRAAVSSFMVVVWGWRLESVW